MQVVLDFVLSQQQEGHKSVSFIGGGEPLIVWDVVKWSIEYLESHKDPSDIIDIYLTTNGTLLNLIKTKASPAFPALKVSGMTHSEPAERINEG